MCLCVCTLSNRSCSDVLPFVVLAMGVHWLGFANRSMRYFASDSVYFCLIPLPFEGEISRIRYLGSVQLQSCLSEALSL